MTDTIVQEVREARAAIAAEFDYDLGKYLAWLREQTEARKKSLRRPKAAKTLEASVEAPAATVSRKRRVRSSRVAG